MQWFFIALAAPFLWALVNVTDNYLVGRFSNKEKERSSGGLVLFSSLIGLIIAFVIWIFIPNVFYIPFWDKLILLVCGVLTVVWITLYLFSLEIEETSSVVPWFLIVPVFGYILGYIFLGETLVFKQFVGSGIIFAGVVLLSINFESGKKKFKGKHVYYMLFASLAIAVSGIAFKYLTVGNDFWVSSFWEYLGLGLSGLLIFLFIPHYRESFLHMNRTGGHIILSVNIGSELLSILGNLMTNFALLLGPVAMVFLVSTFQPAMVLLLTICGTKFFPHIVRENLSSEKIAVKVTALLCMILGSVVLFL
jgi:drug/metabolite transporter (DMT)-like permease